MKNYLVSLDVCLCDRVKNNLGEVLYLDNNRNGKVFILKVPENVTEKQIKGFLDDTFLMRKPYMANTKRYIRNNTILCFLQDMFFDICGCRVVKVKDCKKINIDKNLKFSYTIYGEREERLAS